MCGFAGVVSNLIGVQQDRINERLHRMSDAIAHRGPDAVGHWNDNNIGLAFRRLSIFDLSDAGNQPMHSPDGRYTLVFNGEVYNWPEIRKNLAYTQWRSKTDTETVLHALVERGIEAVDLFNGMFAFALWDSKRRELTLCRDRAGLKPLFYCLEGNTFYFGSEPKALFAGGATKAINYQAYYEFLRWGLIDHDKKTFFKNVYSLDQGTYAKFSMEEGTQGEFKISRYWDLREIVRNSPKIPEHETVERYIDLFDSAIDLRLRADVEVGAALSGGVDSSVLVARMSTVMESGSPHCFTYEFDSGGRGEGAYAREVTESLQCKSSLAVLHVEDVPEYMDKVVGMHEAPVTSLRVLAHHRMYEEVKAHGIKVLLEGSGGDELGGGCEYYYLPRVLDMLLQCDNSDACGLLHRYMDRFHIPAEKRIERLLDCLQMTLKPGIATQDGVSFVAPHCLQPDFLGGHSDEDSFFDDIGSEWLLNLQYKDFQHIVLPRALRYADRASMSVGCEAREPLLDHRIIEFSFLTEPTTRLTNDGYPRDFMRKAAKRILPAEIIERPKRTIVDPQRSWLRHELRDWIMDLFLSQSLREAGIVDVDKVIAEYESYRGEDNPRTSFHLFQYINLATWLQQM